MTPDQIIEVLQGVKVGRKWGIRFRSSGDLVEQASQEAESLCRCIVANDVERVELLPLPDEITIPARVIPAPLREAPKVGTLVWSADPTLSTFSGAFTWNGGEWAVRQLERGFVYMEQKPSEQAGEAMCHYA